MPLHEKKLEKPVVSSAAGSPYRVLDFGQIQVQIQVAELTPENFREHLAAESKRIESLLRGRDTAVPRKAVVINDGSCELIPQASVRKLQADWINQHANMLKLICHGLGVIVPSAITRSAMTAVLWLAPLPVPMKAFKDMDEALAWAKAEVASIGGTIDDELRLGGRATIEKHLRAARDSARDQSLSKRGPSRHG